MFDAFLCNFGIFDSAIHAFDSHNMFNIQLHYTINLCIALYLNYEKIEVLTSPLL